MPVDPIVLEGVRLNIGEAETTLTDKAARRLGIDPGDITGLTIIRRSLDARKKRDIHHIVHLEITLSDPGLRERLLERGPARVSRSTVKHPLDRAILDGLNPDQAAEPPVVVGTGPAGLLAAWLLAREGLAPIVLERGPEVPTRVRSVRAFDRGGPHEPESNILFGEGGAGTFSDGKLTTRMRTPLNELIHRLFVEAGAPPDILFESKPHIGTDRLRAVLVKFRKELVRLGCAFRFQTRVTGLETGAGGTVRAVLLEGGERLPASKVILAIGHSARDTAAGLAVAGVRLEFKPFQLGLRIEHPQAMIDDAQFGVFAPRLPAAEYVLNDAGAGVFSFCMCPGGTIVASISEPEHLCTNGMSRRRRNSGWANSGLVFTIGQDLVPGGGSRWSDGIDLQRRLEGRAFELSGGTYALPAQRAVDFLRDRTTSEPMQSSFTRDLVPALLTEVLPTHAAIAIKGALRTFDRKIPGYVGEGLLVGPEARGSSPFRIPRDPESRESVSTPGLYPVGEGAGYAGGIMSAAVDGLRSAAALIQAL